MLITDFQNEMRTVTARLSHAAGYRICATRKSCKAGWQRFGMSYLPPVDLIRTYINTVVSRVSDK